ncbi:hypothetical protein [Marinoscillum pacificum]|uniref:hypothetical protein n=1 Tax=Marinoscillum pacificum TaxID=392723 RepID=UPI0021579F58|nr:hypothetical protein [Marinoscillum pacificum]
MKFIIAILLALLFLETQSQRLVDGSDVSIMSYWNVEDTLDFQYNRSRHAFEDTSSLYDVTWNIQLVVTDSTDDSYTLDWYYKDFTSEIRSNGEIMDELAEEVLQKMKGLRIKYRTNELGTFTTIINWKEIRPILNKIYVYQYQKLGTTQYGTQMQNDFSRTKSIYIDQSAFEASHLMREIQQFHYLYGVLVTEGEVQQFQMEQQSPLTNGSIPVDVSLQLSKLDKVAAVGEITIKQKFGEEAIEILINATKDRFRQIGREIPEDVDVPLIDITEEYKFKYDLNSGWPIEISHIKETKSEYSHSVDESTFNLNPNKVSSLE